MNRTQFNLAAIARENEKYLAAIARKERSKKLNETGGVGRPKENRLPNAAFGRRSEPELLRCGTLEKRAGFCYSISSNAPTVKLFCTFFAHRERVLNNRSRRNVNIKNNMQHLGRVVERYTQGI